ncbi:MAG: C-GCAxxG-C-C family protein [Desulfurococcales archaeon]|nr:C-GCAxxG-C-C family protein [Desulfurococcales archaeon]
MTRKGFTRRDFIRAAVAAAIGSYAYMAAGSVAKAITPPITQNQTAPPLPWPYTRLDPEETRKLGHLGYYAFECAGGAFWAIAVQLKEKIGYPWTLIPLPSREEVLEKVNNGEHFHNAFFQFGAGGAVGWGTICGALNGSLMIFNMVVEDKSKWTKLGRALLRWYEIFPFPSDKSNQYAVNGKFYPAKLKSSKSLPQSVSNSTLCHVSVSRWCVASGYASGSSERSERCGRLTGDVAAMVVELLNAYFDGRLEEVIAAYSASTLTPTTASCRTCHYKGKDYEEGQFARGYLECESCHRDMTPHAHQILGLEGGENGLTGEGGSPSKALVGFIAGAAIGGTAGAVAGFKNGKKPEEPGEEG